MWLPTRKQLALKSAGTGGFNVAGSTGSLPVPAAALGGVNDPG